MVTIRTLLAVATARKWDVHQMDIYDTFLRGDLFEEVYIKLPPGFSHGHQTQVCKLRKSLYGPKQAPHCWFAKLIFALKACGFRPSYSDCSFLPILSQMFFCVYWSI